MNNSQSTEMESRFFNFNHPLQANSQKIVASLRHRVAVQKALEMIEARMQDPPTLAELACCSGLSRTYFSYVFKEVTGMRLQDYLTETRLIRAKDLLKNNDLRIKQIAYQTGFKDSNYFCRSFKNKTGLNPTNWRLGKIFPLQYRNKIKKIVTFSSGMKKEAVLTFKQG